MAFVFIIIGAVILTAGVQNTQGDLWTLLKGDFLPSQQPQGQTSFVPWVLAILIVGGLGYVKELRGFSRGFMALIIIAMVIHAYKLNPQIFNQFNSALGIQKTTL